MKRLFKPLLFIAFLYIGFLPIHHIYNDAYATESETSETNYIVVFNDSETDVQSVSNQIGTYYGIKTKYIYQKTLKGFSASIPSDKLEKVRLDKKVRYIAEDKIIQADGKPPRPTATPKPNPRNTPTPTGTLPVSTQIIPLGLQRIGITSNQSQTPGDITVAILDTGVDLNHPDLATNILLSLDCLSGKCVSGGNDDNGHGTHVAGTIAALDNTYGVVGIVPNSKIVSLKVLDRKGSGYWSDIIAGIDWITVNASQFSIKVVNMSLSGTSNTDNNCGNSSNDPLHQAICASTASGLTYVVAAGNESTDTIYKVPAGYNDTVITVSALVDTDGKPGGLGGTSAYGNDDTFAVFSNFGTAVDIGAPGANIYSTVKGDTYGYNSGTSMSAPHISGAAARYIKQNPDSNWQQVLNGLINLAEPLNNGHTDPSGKHPEPVVSVSIL